MELCVGPGRDSPQLRVTTLGQQQHPTPPRGRLWGRHVAREDDILQCINSEFGPHGKVSDPYIYRPGLQVRSRTSTGANRTPRMGSGPLCVGAAHSRVPGFWDREYPGLNQGQVGVRSRHVSGSYRIHCCFPPKWRPDAAAWPTARGVSQRAEPDVRHLGYTASAFIEEGAPPVHSTGRRCATSAFIQTCPFLWQAATCPFRRRSACPFHWQAARPYCRVHYAHKNSHVTKEATTTYKYFVDCGHHGARRLLRSYLH
jgi:hypothetical protein